VPYKGRSGIVDRPLDAGDAVVLEREPRNSFDANAVAVRLGTGEQIGYVPARFAREVAPLLDAYQFSARTGPAKVSDE